MNKIGIIGAMSEELALIKSSMKAESSFKRPDMSFFPEASETRKL